MNKDSDGRRDFDFWMGNWRIRNRKLRERLKGCALWEEFEAKGVTRALLNGLGNEDEFRIGDGRDFVGMSFRFFNPATGLWSIYWADSRRGTLEPPVVGSFASGTGTFFGDDTFEGRPIRVRFIWSRVDTPNPRWEQAFSADGGATWETNWVMDMTRETEAPRDFPVIEFRRYTIKPGQRDAFASRFDAYFPEAFEQIGALALGQFVDRVNPSGFTWLRGFPDFDARATMNAAFYSGPLWKEHAAGMNGMIVDSDDVLLLRPLGPDHSVPVFPAVDPASQSPESGRVVIAQLFPVNPGTEEAFAERAREAFAAYRMGGVEEAGILVTLNLPNNFPRHPIRTDGPWLVWLGIVDRDQVSEERFTALADRTAGGLSALGLQRGPAELMFLGPTRRSRLR